MNIVKKIVFIHSLNDFSGSPKVLSAIIRELSDKFETELITSRGKGFLSDISDVKYIDNYYQWYNDSKLKTAVRLFVSQIFVFFKILFYKKTNTLFYINTVMPFAAALACRLSRKTMIYHVHENMNLAKSLYWLYRLVYQRTNTKTIFVSEYLKQITQQTRNSCVVYNFLDDDFLKERDNHFSSTDKNKRFTVLMVSSLRRYKGVDEFVKLATLLPEYTFELVVSSKEKDINAYFGDTVLPENLKIFPLQTNLHPFYQNAEILLQLSLVSKNSQAKGIDPCIETFGLTILEAMSYGIPAIVPNEGGPIELIDDSVNGYTLNPLDTEHIKLKIQALMADRNLYCNFSDKALKKSRKFNKNNSIKQIEEYILL